ncbi:helix-turn-helix transcriptional regulator [Nocardia sp. BMG111209]|uniref:helix-turn-helix transcriptional regulator n=1 Tax=Nocardia sp. BMG111209 TaxID=1160137 RepID=UPI000380A5C8|nr:helix-turn-helix transcriptional regulator [Nocardia sp. BMG111209]
MNRESIDRPARDPCEVTAPAAYTDTDDHVAVPDAAAPVSGPAMQRAIDHLHAHPDRPITITELAGRAGVSARALQYAFRRAYDTTPLQYLRRIRLQRAHRDLTAASPGHDSVAVIAARWGFTNPGRFAVAYRHRYGISPGHTLRQ